MDSISPATYIDTPHAWETCLQIIQQETQLAVDLESNGLFAYREEICLIQISTRTHDFIIDPFAPLDWKPLGRIMEDPAIEKIFHACEYDLILMRRQHGWHVKNVFDTMWASRILGYDKIGLASMLGCLYDITISKKYQRANWGERPLQEDQLRYAQLDTHYLFRMRDDLAKRIQTDESWEEALEIFAEQANVTLPDLSFSVDDFWSIKGLKEVPKAKLGIVQALTIFRDEMAEKSNRPAFKIFGNKTILELAISTPNSNRQLLSMKNVPTWVAHRYGRGILAAIKAGKQAEKPVYPRKERTPDDVVDRYELIKQWRKERAIARGVASDVILHRLAMWDIAHVNPQTLSELSTIDAIGEWRFNAYGQEILDCLQTD